MAILPIRRLGDPVLREKAKPIGEIDDDLRKLVADMAETMYDAPGVGLAANQIGILKRVMVLDVDAEKGDLRVFVNPEIVWQSDEKEEDEEGCLSVLPDAKVPVARAKQVKLKALDLDGKEVTFTAEGLLARAIQHEMDHLDGLLIINRTDRRSRREILKQLSEIR